MTPVYKAIETDEFYKNFIDGQPHKELNASFSIGQQIAKLSEGIDLVSVELQSQVREQHGALLSQASHAGRLVSALETVDTLVERLKRCANRLKHQVNTPFKQLENQTKVLGRLHDVSHLLRQSGRLLQLYKKLLVTKEPFQQALILFELEPLVEDDELSAIEFIKEEKIAIVVAKQKVLNIANRDIAIGLKTGNETQVTNGLQIYYNLQITRKCMDNMSTTFLRDIQQSVKDCFAGNDVISMSQQKKIQKKNTPKGPGKTPTLTTSQNFRSKFWNAIEWLFTEEILSICQQIVLLDKCMATINSNAREDKDLQIWHSFWIELQQLIGKLFTTECPLHITQCLQEGLPKLLATSKELQSKLKPHVTLDEKLFVQLEAGYLEKCGANLKVPITGSECPTQDMVDALVRVAGTELSAALVDQRLTMLVANVFSACSKHLWTKIEGFIKLGTDSMQVVDVPNAGQTQNIQFANLIQYHNQAVHRMIKSMGTQFETSTAAEQIINDLKTGQAIVQNILQQLKDSINSTVHIILLSMHREPSLNSNAPVGANPSLYIKELQDFLNRAWNAHICPFNDAENVEKCGIDLIARCIELFIRNVAIIRPLSENGRIKLKNDCQHLENALRPIIHDSSSVGKTFRQLRSISSLITLPADKLGGQLDAETGGAVPAYIVLMMMFNYAGNELTSPHASAGWSVEKLIGWLDGHTSDRERMDLISGTLHKYRTVVRQKNIAQYDPIYPLIQSNLEKLIN